MSDEPQAGVGIHEAKQLIMEAVPYVRKKMSEGLKYSIASEAEFISRVRPAMLANHIDVAPSEVELVEGGTLVTSTGKTMACRVVRAVYRFTHSPSGTWQDVAVLGEGADSLDKATPKAMTGAFKIALRQWLMIETGDDPDTIQEADAAHLSPAAKKAQLAIAAAGKDELAKLQRRMIGSHSIPRAEQVYLARLLEQRRGDLAGMDDYEVDEDAYENAPKTPAADPAQEGA